MPKAFTTWTVLPHQPIQRLTDNLWTVTGKLPNMSLERIMTLARMSDGRVIVHNAMALEDDLMQEIEGWGAIAYIVVPNGWHRLDCAVFKERYPDARILCPAGSRKKVEQVVSVDLTYEEFPDDSAVTFAYVDGLRDAEGVMTVRAADGVTLVFNDLVFNVPHLRGAEGFIMRLIGSTGGPRVTRMMRVYAVKDRKAVRRHLERLADTPELVRVIPGHGHIMDQDAPATLRAIASRL